MILEQIDDKLLKLAKQADEDLKDIFENILNIQRGIDPDLMSCSSVLVKLAMNIKNVEEKLMEILKDRNILNLNVNPSLLMDHLFLKIIKEE